MAHEYLVAIPPDGGWGWVVIVVSFYGIGCIDVPTLGFQVVLPFLEELFGKPASTVSIIFSMNTLLLQLLGPIAGGICNRFGFRTTAIIGTLLMMIAFVPLLFAHSYIVFILFFGVVAGTGSSFVALVCSVAPGFWFEEKRAIALGLVSSATGVSLFSVAFSDTIASHFGWRYTFLFWTLLMTIMGLLSFLLHPPPMMELQGESNLEHTLPKQKVTALDVINTAKLHQIESTHNTGTLVKRKINDMVKETGIPLATTSLKVPSRYKDVQHEPMGCAKCCRCCSCGSRCHTMFGSRPLYRKDIFYQGNLEHAPELGQVSSRTYTLKLTKLPTVKDVKEEVECHCKLPEAVLRAIKDMIDFSLFKSWVFLLLVTATLFCYVAIYIPFLQIKRVNMGKMEEPYVSMLPIVMGIGLLFFRASIGFFLYYFPALSALLVLTMASITAGLVFCSVPLSNEVPYQIILAFFGGAFPSVINPLRSVVIIEQLGLDKLTSCVGNLFFVQGIACFIGLSIAELLIEKSGFAYAGILFSGVCLILTGITFALIGIVVQIEKTPITTTSAVSAL